MPCANLEFRPWSNAGKRGRIDPWRILKRHVLLLVWFYTTENQTEKICLHQLLIRQQRMEQQRMEQQEQQQQCKSVRWRVCLVGATTVCLPILNCPVWDGLFLLNSKMVLVLLSFPFLLRQIVQSLPESTRKTGWLVKLCFQIVFPNCVFFQIVGVPNCIPPDRCNAKHKQGKWKEREREQKRTRKNAKKNRVNTKQTNCNDQ